MTSPLGYVSTERGTFKWGTTERFLTIENHVATIPKSSPNPPREVSGGPRKLFTCLVPIHAVIYLDYAPGSILERPKLDKSLVFVGGVWDKRLGQMGVSFLWEFQDCGFPLGVPFKRQKRGTLKKDTPINPRNSASAQNADRWMGVSK